MKTKRIIKTLIIIITCAILVFCIDAKAASAGLMVSSNNVTEGDTFTATVNMSSAAAWNIHVAASGPVSGCVINQADDSYDSNTGQLKNIDKTFSATCTATGPGTITISLSGDVSSYNADAGKIEKSKLSGTATVTVSEKQVPSPSPSDSPSPSPSDSPSPSPSDSPSPSPSNSASPKPNSDKDKESNKKSTNNNVKDITVDGKSATKVDAHNYTMTVGNGSSTVTIKAVLEDSKAKVSGTGTKDLKVGENEFEIVVTSESGSKNKIKLVITRKESNSLENLAEALENESGNEVEIKIENDTKLTAEDLEKIKDSNKKVVLNYFNDQNNLEYSWELDGQDLYLFNEFDTALLETNPNKEKIKELTNNKDGIYITTAQTGKFPTGTKLKIYVGDQYQNGDKVTVYYYDSETNKIEVVSETVTIKNGYVQFRTEKGSDYFISEAEVEEETIVDEQESKPLFMIILCAIVVGVFGFIIFTISRNRKNNKPIQILSDEPTNEPKEDMEKEQIDEPKEDVEKEPEDFREF